MAQPRVLILRAPGTNCDLETAYAFEQAGAIAERVHIQQVLGDSQLTRTYQILCIPGGFSYGDDIAAGRILAIQIQHHLYECLAQFREAGNLLLGICNGFQVLIKSRLLLEDHARQTPTATLTWNDSGRFEDRWVHLRADGQKSVFLQGIERMYLPIAHAEGKFVIRDERTLSELEQAGQLALRYTSASGDDRAMSYPDDPNGSMGHVAGICDRTGRVLGLMPHPERYIDPTQHPRWTRGEAPEVGDGLALFQNAVRYFQ